MSRIKNTFDFSQIGCHSLPLMLMAALVFVSCHPQDQKLGDEDQALDRVVVGYVTSWSDRMPDPNLVTHLNYAFGHVTTGFDSVRVDNPERLFSIVALKEANPHLKVLLSVGGWGSGNFSEMATDEAHRISFARSCQKVIDTYSLDGIDIDWEYPTSSAAGISSSPDDTKNFTLLMHDLRQAIGTDHLLTFADYADTTYVDYPSVMPIIDFSLCTATHFSGVLMYLCIAGDTEPIIQQSRSQFLTFLRTISASGLFQSSSHVCSLRLPITSLSLVPFQGMTSQ